MTKRRALGPAVKIPKDRHAGIRPAKREPEAESQKRKKLRFTVNLDPGVIEDIRNAVAQLCGPPAYLTLSSLVEGAVQAEIKKLEKRYNGGRSFPARDYELKAGRPRTR